MSGKKKKKPRGGDAKTAAAIADNRKARRDYFIEEQFEAGLALLGWEVKSLREGRAQIKESYVAVRSGEVFLSGAHFSPLPNAAVAGNLPGPRRERKLLLNRHEIDRLGGYVVQRGYTLVPLSLYWKRGRAKIRIALARGKKQYDKRADVKEREWQREKQRLFRRGQR